MESRIFTDYDHQNIHFITDLDIPKDVSDRDVKKLIQQYNHHAAILRKRVADRILTPSEPDTIIAVQQFFANNQSLLMAIKEKYDSKIKDEHAKEEVNKKIAAVDLMLEHAKNFESWTQAVIPEWLERRKCIISLPSFSHNQLNPRKAYVFYIRYLMQQEKIPINLSFELDLLSEVLRLVLSNKELSLADFSIEFEEPLEQFTSLIVATQVTGGYDIAFYKKIMEVLSVSQDFAHIKHFEKLKTKFLLQIMKTLTEIESSPEKEADKENCMKYLYSLLSPLEQVLLHHMKRDDNNVIDEIYLTLSKTILIIHDDEALSRLIEIAEKMYREDVVIFAIHFFDNAPAEFKQKYPISPEKQKYIDCVKSQGSITDYMNSAVDCLGHCGPVLFYSSILAHALLQKYALADIINFMISDNNKLGKGGNYLFAEIVKLFKQHHLASLDVKTKRKLVYLSHNFEPDKVKVIDMLNFKTRLAPVSYCEQEINMPFGLYTAILQTSMEIPESFHQFYERFEKAQSHYRHQREGHAQEELNEVNYVDYKKFMFFNMDKMANLHKFMGDDVFLFMKKMIATSANEIDRYFKVLSIIPNEYFSALQRLQERFPEDFKDRQSPYDIILIQIVQLEELLKEIEGDNLGVEKERNNLAREFYNVCHKGSFQDISNWLSEKNITFYKELLNLPLDEEFDFSKLLQDKNLFSRLLIGRKKMKNERLGKVFDKLIEYDLKSEKEFHDFTRDINQEDKLGQKLAQHNKNIEQELRDKGINTDLAFNFDKTVDFSVGGNTAVDKDILLDAVYKDLKSLQDIFNNKEKELEQSSMTLFSGNKNNPISIIKNKIEKIIKEIEKGKKPLPDKLVEPLAGSRQKIAADLQALLKHENLLAELKEHGKHFLDHNTALDNAIKSADTTSKKNEKTVPEKHFVLQQWDKSRMDTFLLGDYLSCCLAPDGGRFPAIVQRRLDDAMMMHVMFDKEINEPVCGNWLFFARDKNNPADIYVVANYFEIRAGYGLNKTISAELVKQLTDFTGEYAKAVGAKDFIIRPLTYGLIPDFNDKKDEKDKYATLEIEIEKVGGFFSPLEYEDDSRAVDRYYLNALDLKEFYVYQAAPKEELVLTSTLMQKK